MGRMENPDSAMAGATGAGNSELAFTSPDYRYRAEQATSLCLAIEACHPEDAAPILWAALDTFHANGLPASPMLGLMRQATEWADQATENERKAYAVAAARRMNPATREAFRLYLGGVA